ncbi:sulfite exporter TauE/SafE family protein [Pararobbsia alpina]|uniref:Probable membrane transporter protein n=1 Tax=Pararobbsia alpina TaxID=621374 RepID=A0A6S7BJB6_9BURK|nr:sulfite exporter TauE/SafE family protein [Pararobbsia alpina]CAB3802210.1 hypothetical protein LMG28138_05149 [Pararobbsia alpina]
MISTGLISDPWFYLLSIPALLLTNFSKGGFGLGLGILAVPLMALRLPVPEVVTLLLPVLCLTDLITLWEYRGQWSWPLLRVAVPAALVGIGFGALAIHHLPETWLRLGIGIISIDFVRRRWSGSRRSAQEDRGPRPAAGVFWGAISGFTSFLANAGEPALTVYLLPLKLSNRSFAGTTAAFFMVVNFAKLISFSMLGMFTRTSLLTSLILTPIAVLGIWAGVRLNRRLDATLFYKCSHVILLVIGSRLIYTSLKAIL